MDTDTVDREGCYDNRSVEFFYELSAKNISKEWRDRDYVIVTLGMTVCFIVIFSNLLVIAAILKNRRFHFPIYYLLGNLALADLFSGVSYLHLMFHTGPWTLKLTKDRWFVRQGLIDTSLTASVLNLLAVAVERHQTIFNMTLHSKMSTRRVFVVMVFIWLVAIVMGLIPIMGWNCLCNLPDCSTMAPMYSRSYLVFWGVLNLLTFSIMVAVYTRIFLYVRHKSQQMSQHTSQRRHRDTVFNLMKTVSMILFHLLLLLLLVVLLMFLVLLVSSVVSPSLLSLLLPVFRTISLALPSRWTRPTGFFSSVHQRTPPPQKPERDAADAPDCDWRTSSGLKNSGDTKSPRTRSVLPDVSGSSPWSPVLLHGAVRSRRICVWFPIELVCVPPWSLRGPSVVPVKSPTHSERYLDHSV